MKLWRGDNALNEQVSPERKKRSPIPLTTLARNRWRLKRFTLSWSAC